MASIFEGQKHSPAMVIRLAMNRVTADVLMSNHMVTLAYTILNHAGWHISNPNTPRPEGQESAVNPKLFDSNRSL